MSDITVTLTGFNTPEEAEAFVSWYEGAGQDDAVYWLEVIKSEGKIGTEFMPAYGPCKWDHERLNLTQNLKMRYDL